VETLKNSGFLKPQKQTKDGIKTYRIHVQKLHTVNDHVQKLHRGGVQKLHTVNSTGSAKIAQGKASKNGTAANTLKNQEVDIKEEMLSKDSKEVKTSKEDPIETINKNSKTVRARGDKRRKWVEEAFVAASGIPSPIANTVGERRAAGTRWWQPLRRMLLMADNDERRAAEIIQAAVANMRGDGLTVAAPQSIESTFTSKLGEGNTGSNGQEPHRSDLGNATVMYLQTASGKTYYLDEREGMRAAGEAGLSLEYVWGVAGENLFKKLRGEGKI
jgi:hypothetical protein